jgi:hypothetical protein
MGGGGGDGVGHAIAGGLGLAVLWAIAASLVAQVYLLGLCLVYLRVTEGLDLSATEAALRQKLDEAATAPATSAKRHARRQPRDRAIAASAGGDAAAALRLAGADATALQHRRGRRRCGWRLVRDRATAGRSAQTPFEVYRPETPPTTSTDIDLPFDDIPTTTPAAAPSYSPPAYSPPTYVPPPAQPAAPAVPAASTCPQCLSAITSDDVFCGVCGYRLK